jgi:enamine deaminase RidA (YjgF/YER057c/UK114 family)
VRRHISSGGPWEERVGYARAVVVGDRVWLAGTTGTRPDGTVPPSANEQTALALDVIERALQEVGSGLADVVAVRLYVTDIAGAQSVLDEYTRRLGSARPALTMVQVARLMLPAHLVEIEVEAVVGSGAS